MLSRLKQRLFLKIPTDLERIYRVCKAYVERHDGELNGDMDSNGEMWLAKQICGAAKVVFDVGANRGDWSRRVLELNPKLALHSFEPSAHAFEKLRTAAPSAVCNHFGLSNAKHTSTLYSFGEGHPMNSMYQRKGVQPTDQELCQTASEVIRLDTIDDYCVQRRIERIDFLKIDAEGHDLEVLRGGISMLRGKRIHLAQFEYSGCNLDSGKFLADFFELFDGHGYALAKLLPASLRPVARYDRGLETFRYQNWIAYPRTRPPRFA